ncbi:extracellular calcium-sensing receptor-like [Bufo bufo]|uniref:extracellular calcium-sensing receptor-like n=1 Tax=Bufo bufo TaxID=8384 RepID=UPI001ABE0A72|nr:extracellular calcium-sensing receptor-like [Bufo bufo]
MRRRCSLYLEAPLLQVLAHICLIFLQEAYVLPMRLSKILVFLALITGVQESSQNRCRLENQSIESFSSPGDIVLGVITLIHSTIYQPHEMYEKKPQEASCEDFLIRYYRDVLAVMFAVEQINENAHLLPNLTLGFHIFDSCVSEARAIQATLMILWEEKGSYYESIQSWKDPFLAGIIGDSMSTLSMPIARILGPCHYPQISFGAFDPDLGDRDQFPTFLRTVPNENIQNKAISQLLKHLGWTWVGILTRDDDLGVLDGQHLKEEIHSHQGCVAFLEKIHYRYPMDRIKKIHNIVMDSTAVVVVVYCEEMHIKPLLDMMSKAETKGKIWVYTLSFTFIPGIFSKRTSMLLNGSIGLVLHSEPLPRFDGYLQQIHPYKNSEDIYIKEFWEVAFDCSWHPDDPSANDTENVIYCTGEEDLENKVESLFELGDLSYTFQAYIAVYAFAYALHNLLHHMSPRLKSGSCGEKHLLPWQVYRYLKRISFTTSSGDEIFFNDIGEIPATFDIMNLQIFPNNDYRLVKVGRYDSWATTREAISLDIGAVVWNQEYKEKVSANNPHPPEELTENITNAIRSITSRISQHNPTCPEMLTPEWGPFSASFLTCRFHGQFAVKAVNLEPGKSPYMTVRCAASTVFHVRSEKSRMRLVMEIAKPAVAPVTLCPEDMWPNEKQDDCLMKKLQFLSYEDIMGVSLAAASISFSILTLSILCIFRKFSDTPVVKANNRSLSYIILVGLIVCFLSSLIFIGYPLGVLCILRQVVFGVSFSVVVSGMLAKTVTVILIFQSTKPNSVGKCFDSRFSKVVMSIGPLLQVIICTVWLWKSPPYTELNMVSKPDTIIAQCNEGSSLGFYSMLGYMGLLATISFFVAFLSRKLPDSFREGQCINFSMFVFLTVWICFIPTYLSSEGKNLVIVEVFAIMASSAGLLVCLFFPKCYIILFKPEMNTKQYVRGKQ